MTNNENKLLLTVSGLLMISISSFCQVIEGVILDKSTSEPIPYVNIGYLNRSIGTVSDQKGFFRLNAEKISGSDSLGFSSIGYKTLIINAVDIANTGAEVRKILLEPVVYPIGEVVVKPQKISYVTVGNGKGDKRKKAGFGPNDKLGREMGTVIPVKKEGAFIEKAMVTIGVNNYGKIKLRLNLYNFENNMPREKINTVPIYFETAIKEGLCVIDLEQYRLRADKDFFISVEYIENMGEYGLYFTFSFDKSPSFYRETSMSPWKETVYEGHKVCVSLNAVLGYPATKKQ